MALVGELKGKGNKVCREVTMTEVNSSFRFLYLLSARMMLTCYEKTEYTEFESQDITLITVVL